MRVDWAQLRAAAIDAMRYAYAPYSAFPVGAAALVDDGRVVVGCNVENSSYGVGLCAECGVVSALHAGGGGRLVALSCVDGAGEPLMPCGRCRQLLWEHGGPDCLVDAPGAPRPLADLLPHAFDAQALAAVTGPAAGVARAGAGAGPESSGAAGTAAAARAVPAALSAFRGRGTVFVHPDLAGGQRVWTGYWERSTGLQRAGEAVPAGPPESAPDGGGEPRHGTGTVDTTPRRDMLGMSARTEPPDAELPGILEEAPSWPSPADAIAWGRARTPRVVVVDADGDTWWAGEGEPPAGMGRVWPA